MLEIDYLRTTVYHPQANGIIERWHRTVKAAIMYILPLILLWLHSAFKPDIQTTSAQLVYGATLRLVGGKMMREIRSIQTAHHRQLTSYYATTPSVHPFNHLTMNALKLNKKGSSLRQAEACLPLQL